VHIEHGVLSLLVLKKSPQKKKRPVGFYESVLRRLRKIALFGNFKLESSVGLFMERSVGNGYKKAGIGR
jgi:hypothetical protein